MADAGDRRFEIAGSAPLVVGRELSSTLPVLDPVVSRRHAELRLADDGTVDVYDLDSRNGTWVNGVRVSHATLTVGDTIAFGTIAFTLEQAGEPDQPPSAWFDGERALRHERAVPSLEQALADLTQSTAGHALTTARLARLVGIAQHLGGVTDLDALLDAIADDLFGTFEADRVAILLRGTDDQLHTRVSRDRVGAIARPVPRAIAHGVAERQVALLTNDARRDTRTAGLSVHRQAVRSAMAAPLMGSQRVTLGVLYVDHLREGPEFTDDDLALLVAVAAIVSVAVEREAATARLVHATHARANFARYFAPQIAARIADDAGIAAPGGTRQRVVVFFSDVRGFTTIAETLPPTQMAAQLNEYFAVMVSCLFRHGGALDKFIGDAMMAYWGAPTATEHDVDHAVAAAIDMQQALRTLNARWDHEGRARFEVGIGIHVGDAFVGNIGSPQRLEFTLIGDTVNIANRLCALAAGGDILLSDAARVELAPGTTCTARPDLTLPRQQGSPQAIWQVSAA